MFEFMIRLSGLALPVFIFLTTANVGLTPDPARIVEHWKNWPFYLRLLIANFVAAPALMWLLLQFWPLLPEYRAGLMTYSMCAGAPFLIKLTATAEHEMAFGAATMTLLVLATIVIAPLVLPVLLVQLSVDGKAMAWAMARQLLLPMVAGGLLTHFLPQLSRRLQPWVAKLGNAALYVVLIATILGYLPQTPPILRSGALILGLVFVLAAFGLGFLAGRGKDHLEDIGGLATAQRNTAATMLIAVNSFTDPSVFVLVTLVSTIGIVALIAVAKLLKADNIKVTAV
jgi:BASS family bile acid:Na+ symporter